MVAETTDARLQQIQRIAESKAFRTSEVQRNLLQYLAEKAIAGEGDTVKEYSIGLDVFSKPASFDPRQESSVRMHAARLRQKLAEYYRTEGVDDTIVVEVPKGGFKLVFEERTGPVALETSEAALDRAQRRAPWLVLAAAAVAIVGVSGYWMLRPAAAAEVPGIAEAAAMSAELAELWAPFFNSPRPILVCLAVPKDNANSNGTANGAFFLGQFLNPSRKREVLLTRSDQISMPEIAMDNVVFVGSTAGSRQIDSIPMAAQLTLDEKGVRNSKPQPGEEAYYADRVGQKAPGAADESYALISHVPGLYGNGEVLLLEGNHTSSVMAAVRSFTDPGLGGQMLNKLKSGGKLPRHYQVLLRVRSVDEMPVEVSYVLHREIAAR